MNFAPVADIFLTPVNKVIGKRAYGTEPQLVPNGTPGGGGFAEGRIIPVLKHFPGHGDTAEDTHTGAAVVEHDLERLTGFELMPQGRDRGRADAVMVAHIILPKLMEEPVRHYFKEVVTGLLRKSSCLTVSSSPMP